MDNVQVRRKDKSVGSINTVKIPLLKKLGFSAYQLASITDTMINTWQMYYYTTFLGINVFWLL